MPTFGSYPRWLTKIVDDGLASAASMIGRTFVAIQPGRRSRAALVHLLVWSPSARNSQHEVTVGEGGEQPLE